MPRMPLPRLTGRLYIFPAFIPLVEIVPWLLAGIGALAGMAQAAAVRRNRLLVWLAIACLVCALAVFAWNTRETPTDVEGSRAVAVRDMSRLETAQPAPAAVSAPPVSDVFTPLWTVKADSENLSTPVVAGDLLLIGTFDGTLEARSRATGARVWTLHKKEPIFSNAAMAGNVAYVGEGLHTAPASVMTALSLPAGKPLWERRFPSHLEAAVTVDARAHKLWMGAGDAGLWCLDARSGKPLWRTSIGHVDATPLLAGGALYTPALQDAKKDETALFAQDPANGRILWRVMLHGREMGSAQTGIAGTQDTSGDTQDIFVTTAIGQVGPQQPSDKGWAYAVTRQGRVRWGITLPGMPLPEGVVTVGAQGTDIVIYTLKTGSIVALDAAGGHTVWQWQGGREFDAPATLAHIDGTAVLAAITKDGRVVILDAQSGRMLKDFLMPHSGGYAAPVFDGDVLYVTTRRGMTAYGGVHALLPQAGQ